MFPGTLGDFMFIYVLHPLWVGQRGMQVYVHTKMKSCDYAYGVLKSHQTTVIHDRVHDLAKVQ